MVFVMTTFSKYDLTTNGTSSSTGSTTTTTTTFSSGTTTSTTSRSSSTESKTIGFGPPPLGRGKMGEEWSVVSSSSSSANNVKGRRQDQEAQNERDLQQQQQHPNPDPHPNDSRLDDPQRRRRLNESDDSEFISNKTTSDRNSSNVSRSTVGKAQEVQEGLLDKSAVKAKKSHGTKEKEEIGDHILDHSTTNHTHHNKQQKDHHHHHQHSKHRNGNSTTTTSSGFIPGVKTSNLTIHTSNGTSSAKSKTDNELSPEELVREIQRQKDRKERKKRQQERNDPYHDGGNSTHNATGHIRPIDWQAVSLPQRRGERPQNLPNDNVIANKSHDPYPLDPLGGEFDVYSLRRLNVTIDVKNLGVLLDGGRHYYPVDWIKRMIHVISMMQYNLLHFRLTDDQVFNVQLESRPLLAYPSRLNGNTKVYTPDELRDIVAFAKDRGVTVIPEINVPGHAGAWGGMPELIVQCPQFICQKGYSVPLNVSNPLLRPVLKDVLTEIIDIFDKPPLLHLGGDEVDMSIPCTDEVGEVKFDYNVFEKMLREILDEVGYDDSRVIRWEMMKFMEGLDRAGNITHFWFTQPGHTGTGVGHRWGTYYNDFKHPVFNSQGLYFDVNDHDSAHDIYVHAQQNTHLKHTPSPNLGIIAGTFELGVDHWVDRNVIGKLLAVAIGASHIDIRSEHELYTFYKNECRQIGFRDDLCLLYADGPMDFTKFRQNLKNGRESQVTWVQWQKDICERFTTTTDRRVYNPYSRYRNHKTTLVQLGQSSFFGSLDEELNNAVMIDVKNRTLPDAEASVFDDVPRLVEHAGIIVGISTDPVPDYRIRDIVRLSMRPLALGLAQLRLIDDLSFSFQSVTFRDLQYTNIPNKNLPTAAGLVKLRDTAMMNGVSILPEVSLTTNAGGLYKSMFNVECPEYTCQRGSDVTHPWNVGIPADINDSNFVAVAYGIIDEVFGFSSSPFLHFGADERRTVTPCFTEGLREEPNFDSFERKLGKLLQVGNWTNDRIIRWDNEERTHYSGRLGQITQCRPGDDICPEKYGSSDSGSTWMATIDIMDGDGWHIFNKTRWMVTMHNRPMSIVADLGGLSERYFIENRIDMRLLAFNLATVDYSSLSEEDNKKNNNTANFFRIESEDDFIRKYPKVCKKVMPHLGLKPCSMFVNSTSSIGQKKKKPSLFGITDDTTTTTDWRQSVKTLTCNVFTRIEKVNVFRNDTVPTALSIQRDAEAAAAAAAATTATEVSDKELKSSSSAADDEKEKEEEESIPGTVKSSKKKSKKNITPNANAAGTNTTKKTKAATTTTTTTTTNNRIIDETPPRLVSESESESVSVHEA